MSKDATDRPVTILPESECWQLLSGAPLGRLVTSADGMPEIFPVNFAVQRRTVLFRTAEGTKLVSSAINTQVLFEADDYGESEGWSVIVKGMARSLHTEEEIADAESAQLLPWTGTVKEHYVRIRPTRISGRRFRFSRERDREASAD
ncbi:MAG: pyridoxamine 5'-phosphate oxidase family protein [Actinomycetia bacterium]|nr:pyridoxamine 5'-phosphate oxidase family protein [Actinomycetes bacterium]MCH9768928.1 pyridoxamine 5'-phosphate oxidase family protein [Actinomycetes bacterium]